MDQLLPTETNPPAVPSFPWIHQTVLVLFDLRLKVFNLSLGLPYLPLFNTIDHRVQAIGEKGTCVLFTMFPGCLPHCPLLCQGEGT